MGTLGGKPDKAPDPSKGFNDPFGKYPTRDYLADSEREVSGTIVPKKEEPDTNRLARGNMVIPTINNECIINDSVPTSNGENSKSLEWKRKTRQEGVPKALAGDISASIGDEAGKPFYMGSEIDEDPDNFNYYWNEPHPRYGGVKQSKTDFKTKYSSCYPSNHVRQSEAGHVEEWDDTPGAERLHKYHSSGTFEEIQADGTRIVKVIGDNYEIVAGDKNVVITSVPGAEIDNGNLNITVEGDCRLLTMGSMVQEVRGHYHLNVLQDMRVKVGGNMVQEIMSDRKVKIERNDDLDVKKTQIMNIGENAEKQIGKSYSVAAGGAIDMTAGANIVLEAEISACIDAGINVDIISGVKVGISSATVAINGDVAINIFTPIETHEVGIYNAIVLTAWDVEAGATANILVPAGEIGLHCLGGLILIDSMDTNIFGTGIVIVGAPLIELN